MDLQAYYAAFADFIVAFHTFYVGFVVVGQLLILIGLVCRWRWVRNPWFRILHLLCIGVVAAEAMCNVTCPLTTWERDLRALSGQGVADSAIGWFFNSILFFNMPREFFTWIHISFGALVLGTFAFGPPHFRHRKSAPAEQAAALSPTRAATCPIGPSRATVRIERETGLRV